MSVLESLLENAPAKAPAEKWPAADIASTASDLGIDLKGVDVSGMTAPAQEGEQLSEAQWIQGAIKRKGQLHRDLGVPEGKPIPHAALVAAASKPGKLGARARLAIKLKGLSPKSTA